MIVNNNMSKRMCKKCLYKYILSFSLMLILIIFACTDLSYAENLSYVIKKVMPSVVQFSTFDKNGNQVSLGSGFIVNKMGNIITNRHVIEGAYSAKIKTATGKIYSVENILTEDIDGDLICVSVNIPTSLIKPLTISISNMVVGERIIIVGSPLGLDQTASDGIVSSIREMDKIGTVIQLTAPISSGSSGSPVVNIKGDVIGVATFQAAKGQNINFAIPSSRINNNLKPVNMTLQQWEEARKKHTIAPIRKKYLKVNDGFRELPWGIGIDSALKIYPDLVEYKYKPGQEKRIEILGYKYHRVNDDKELGGVNFDKIEYSFKDDKFYSVFASKNCQSGENEKCDDLYNGLIKNIKTNYGKPSNEINEEKDDIKVVNVTWHIGKESITIHYGKGGIYEPLLSFSIFSNQAYKRTIGF